MNLSPKIKTEHIDSYSGIGEPCYKDKDSPLPDSLSLPSLPPSMFDDRLRTIQEEKDIHGLILDDDI